MTQPRRGSDRSGLEPFRHSYPAGRDSELQSNAAIEDPTIQRRPRVHGPPGIDGAIRAEQRIPASLTNVREVLYVYEEFEGANGTLGQEAEENVSLRFGPIGVLLQALMTGARIGVRRVEGRRHVARQPNYPGVPPKRAARREFAEK